MLWNMQEKKLDKMLIVKTAWLTYRIHIFLFEMIHDKELKLSKSNYANKTDKSLCFEYAIE